MSTMEMSSIQNAKCEKQNVFLNHEGQGTLNGVKQSIQMWLTSEHLEIITRRINEDAALVRLMKDNPGKLYIAGGLPVCSLIGAPIGDINIFGTDRLLLMEAARTYGLYSPCHMMEPTKYAVSVNGRIGRVQFELKEVYQSAWECIDSFDFSVCQAAIWFEYGKWQTVCSAKFYSDLNARKLRFINQERDDESPVVSLWRAAKYTERGFTLSRSDKLALLDRCFQNYRRKNVK